MKIALQYVNDSDGNLQSVQVPITDWDKLMLKLKHYEQTLELRLTLQRHLIMLRNYKGKKPKSKP
jgi:hypothetical protein